MKRSVEPLLNPAWIESTRQTTSNDVWSRGADFGESGVTVPAVNIRETVVDLQLEMFAPGMRKDSFTVTVEGHVLNIRYDHEHNQRGDRQGMRYHVREYNYHSFVRSFQLPDTLDTDQVTARYADGILYLRIPRKAEAMGRSIAVA